MSQRYIVLRMASVRDLQEEAAAHRPRYYSTPADLRNGPLVRAASASSSAAAAAALSVRSNRVPNLRKSASAVRSTGDIPGLTASSPLLRLLRDNGHELWSDAGAETARAATACDAERATQKARRRDSRVALLDAVEDTEDAFNEEEESTIEEAEEDEDDDEDDRTRTAWLRAQDHHVGVQDDKGWLEDNAEEAQGEGVAVPKEVMFLVASFIVLVTSGGLILGFGPIYAALLREEQWSELCESSGNTSDRDNGAAPLACPKQEIRLQYVFSTSFLCLSAANAFFGVFLDFFGPRVTAIMGLALAALGNFALSCGDSHTGHGAWIILGYAMIGAGGMGSYLSAFQILQLYKVQGFVCSTLSSLFNCSGYIYMALEIESVTRPLFFRVYGVLVVVCMVICFLLFPTNSITRPCDSLVIPGFRIEMPRIKTPHGLVDGMKEQLQRGDLWYFAVFFGWISLIFAFAGGAIPSMLVDLASNDDGNAAFIYTSILYPVIVNGTFIYSPLVGYVIDRYGFKAIFFACLALVQVFITLLMTPSLKVQIVTFFVYSMAQACLYALQFAYIMMCFPADLNGTLQAFMATVSFTFGLLNYLLNPWAQMFLGGDYTMVLLVLGLPTLVLYFFIDVVQGCEDQIVQDDDADAVVINEMSKLI
uniref:Major facilitator superfamily (MFS) profile domain-containing protein n=1 Tax=Globisporangium ultimum (strain ATCC 200006 / CBS 805.95 / DAOM BR144) TaxID=431595 RepID=K3WBU3_GLOUD